MDTPDYDLERDRAQEAREPQRVSLTDSRGTVYGTLVKTSRDWRPLVTVRWDSGVLERLTPGELNEELA